jgi:hypothetical protein
VARIGLLPRVRCLRSLISANTPASVPRRIFPWRPSTRFFHFWRVDHFVESLACGMPRKAASIGEGTFQISTKGIILSSVSAEEAVLLRNVVSCIATILFAFPQGFT